MINFEDFLRENPDYIEIAESIVEFEENNIDPDHAYIDDKDYDSCWDYSDVRVHPTRLHNMEVKGIITKVFDSNNTTAYATENREKLKTAVNNVSSEFNEGTIQKLHDFPDEEDIEEKGVFDDVVGYDGVKFLVRRAMSADDIVNVLLVGPPGSAKTVFLMCINKLDNSSYISGKPTTGPGFMDKMFNETPRFMAIDEIDQMDKKDQEILSEYTETGMLIETKGNDKQRKMKTNTKTFAAANNQSDIIDNIQNRFTDLHFEQYSRDEFIKVCRHILTRNEDKTEEEAEMIAEAVWDSEGFGNVRKAIQAARLSRGDPEKILGILDEYSSDSDEPLLSGL